MRTKIAAVIALIILGASASAQVSKTVATAAIAACFPDNVVGAITPANVRACLGSLINNYQQYAGVRAVVGTTDTIVASDYGQLVTYSNANPIAVSLSPGSTFTTFNFTASNVSTGTVTITPSAGTINGASSLALTTGQSSWIVSDGTNYVATRAGSPALTGGAGIFITPGLSTTIAMTNVVAAAGPIPPSTITNAVPTITYNTRGQITATSTQPIAPVTNLAGRFGEMDVWQRGAGNTSVFSVSASTTQYTVDGCYLQTGANQASTVTIRTGFAAGSYKSASIQRTAAQTGTGQVNFGCPLDSDEIGMYAGQFVTLSYSSQSGANFSPTSGNVTATLYCGTGSPKKQTLGYTGQTTPIQFVSSVTITPTRYQATSAAIVPANCAQSEIQFSWSPTGTAGANDYFDLDDIQLEVAASASQVASPFARTPFATQLALAQRHYAKTFTYNTAPVQAGGTTNSIAVRDTLATSATMLVWQFPQPMRTAPTITTYNVSASNANCRNFTASADLAVTVDPNATFSTDRIVISCAAGGTAGDNIYLHVQADAGI